MYIRICFRLSDVYTDIFKLGRDLEGNPDINEIVKAMEQEYDKMKEQSRFLIFVKTRATAKALAERLPDYLKSTHLTGSHASTTEGGIQLFLNTENLVGFTGENSNLRPDTYTSCIQRIIFLMPLESYIFNMCRCLTFYTPKEMIDHEYTMNCNLIQSEFSKYWKAK